MLRHLIDFYIFEDSTKNAGFYIWIVLNIIVFIGGVIFASKSSSPFKHFKGFLLFVSYLIINQLIYNFFVFTLSWFIHDYSLIPALLYFVITLFICASSDAFDRSTWKIDEYFEELDNYYLKNKKRIKSIKSDFNRNFKNLPL